MAKKLEAKLSLLEVFCIATGAMISSGLFILPGLAFGQAGPAVVFAYVIAGLACLPTVLSMAELTSAMPKAGGDYFYITRGFGPFVGTVAGLGSWFALSLKSAWALIGMGAYLSLITPMPIERIAIFLCGFFVLLNIFGVKEAGKFQVGLVSGLIAILAVYVAWGGFFVDAAKFTPFFSKGHLAMFSTAGFVFIAYGGLTQIVAMAEEVEDPGRNLLRGIVLSLVVTVLLYGMVVLVTVGLVEPGTLEGTLMPISKGAEVFGGVFFQRFVALSAFLAFVSTGNAGIMSASRYLLGMSRDGHLPNKFGKISPKFKTPYFSILFTGGIIAFSLLVLRLELLVKVGSAVLILLYIFANTAVITFRQSNIPSYRPTYKAPFYPYLQVAGVLVGVFLLLEMETGVLFLTMLFFGAGALFYKYTVHKKVVRDSALDRILLNLCSSDRELTGDDVSTELKNIVISRDNLEEDKYHQNIRKEIWEKIIKGSSVLHINEPVKTESLFRRVAGLLSDEFDLDKLGLKNKFMERESSSSTVVANGVAMPHLLVEENNVSKVIFVRAKTGIVFPEDRIIHTVICVVSSSDQRALHLQILSNFLKMVKSPFFRTEWFLELEEKELRENVLSFMVAKEKNSFKREDRHG